MCPIDSNGKDYRVVLKWKEKTGGKNGHYSTEKFYLPANSRISGRFDRKRRRWLPLVPRSSKGVLLLKDPETGKVQKTVSPDFKGKLSKRGNYKFSIVIHKEGTYYLYIQWGSLVEEIELTFIAPPQE
jgi:hypothetical protein